MNRAISLPAAIGHTIPRPSRNGRRKLTETFANPTTRLFGIVLAAGLLGGGIGAAYLGCCTS